MPRWWRARPVAATYTVIGCVTDDGSTFCPAVTVYGDMRSRLPGKGKPFPGAVLYVVHGAPDLDAATSRALEHFEAEVTEEIWERGEVRYI